MLRLSLTAIRARNVKAAEKYIGPVNVEAAKMPDKLNTLGSSEEEGSRYQDEEATGVPETAVELPISC